jgi:hypothetical protein
MARFGAKKNQQKCNGVESSGREEPYTHGYMIYEKVTVSKNKDEIKNKLLATIPRWQTRGRKQKACFLK